MKASEPSAGHFLFFLFFLLLVSAWCHPAAAQIVPTNDPPVYGPYNARILQGGDGLRKPMVARDTVLRADSPWTLYGWVQTDMPITAPLLVAGVGDVADEYSRFLGLDAGKLMLWMGAYNSFTAPLTVTLGRWQFLAATFDGSTFRLYSDGTQVWAVSIYRVAVLKPSPTTPNDISQSAI